MRRRQLPGLRRLALAVLAVLAVLGVAAPALAGSLTAAELRALFPPPLVVGERQVEPPVWPVFKPEGGRLVLEAQVFETEDLEAVAGYGGKPLNLMVVLDAQGRFRTVQLRAHGEPLFTSAEGTARLAAFARQYEGLTLQHDIQIASPSARRSVTEQQATLHGVVTGTVSAMAIDRAVLESAARVALAEVEASREPGAGATGSAAASGSARAAGTPAATGPDDRFRRSGWHALAQAGLVQHWTISNREVQAEFEAGPGSWRDPGARSWPSGLSVDFWLAPIGWPQAGRNLLDRGGWQQVRALREAGHTLLLVIDGGRYPVMAAAEPAEPRAAVLSLRQEGRRFALKALPYRGGQALSGARSGVARDAVLRLFAVQPAADGSSADLEQPLELVLDLQRGVVPPGEVARAELGRAWRVADAAQFRPQRERPAWLNTAVEAFGKRQADLAVLAAALLVLTIALARQGWLAARPRVLDAFRLGYLAFTLGFIGWWAQGQLTVVTLTSAVEALAAGRSLGFLAADPMAVVLWGFTGLTLLVWGRGTFCGWLCPFGALQELASRLARLIGLRPRPLRRRLDARLKRLKYAVLAVLLVAAVFSGPATAWLVEVEPFKTAISQTFVRSWPFVAWALACVAASVWVFRAFCRYLCPLGAALALLGLLRRWRWIPRRAECGTPCQTCRHRCAWQAIEPDGAVRYEECFQCLDCVAIHQDVRQCLPLVREARRVIPIVAVAR